MQVFESILSSSQRGLGMNPEWIQGVAREKERGLRSKVLLYYLPSGGLGTSEPTSPNLFLHL